MDLKGRQEYFRKRNDKLKAKKLTLVLSRKGHCVLDKSNFIRVLGAGAEFRN